MKYRDHRGGLAESLDTMVDLPATRAALIAHLAATWPFSCGLALDDLTIERYHESGDERIGWKEVWIVALPGFGVIGFTDGGLT